MIVSLGKLRAAWNTTYVKTVYLLQEDVTVQLRFQVKLSSSGCLPIAAQFNGRPVYDISGLDAHQVVEVLFAILDLKDTVSSLYHYKFTKIKILDHNSPHFNDEKKKWRGLVSVARVQHITKKQAFNCFSDVIDPFHEWLPVINVF